MTSKTDYEAAKQAFADSGLGDVEEKFWHSGRTCGRPPYAYTCLRCLTSFEEAPAVIAAATSLALAHDSYMTVCPVPSTGHVITVVAVSRELTLEEIASATTPSRSRRTRESAGENETGAGPTLQTPTPLEQGLEVTHA